MIKNENIVCISSIDWDFIWQGHQEIMSTFAKNGNRVLFIENTGVRTPKLRDISRIRKRVVDWFKSTKGFRKETDNIFVFSPMMLPFPYSKLASWINKKLLIEPLKRWMKAMSFRTPVIWTFLPTSIALDIIDEIDDRKLLVYYDIADFDALTDNPKKLKNTEETLMKKCDVIFAQGKAIADKCEKFNSNVHIFPFGVNIKVFEDFISDPAKLEPSDLKGIRRPIVGYVGGIHKHIDIPLVNYVAKSHPEWSVVLVGPKQIDVREIEAVPNIFILGKKNFEELPAYINMFDVCIVPYLVSDYTKTVYPTKLNEYFVMGKPVVSTALPEVEALNEKNNNVTFIAKTHKEFAELVGKALISDTTKTSSERVAVAKKNSWNDRIGKMSSLMEEAIERKQECAPVNWQDRFLMLYKNTRHTIMKSLTVALATYALVFYTPIVWTIAQPLVVSERPVKADAIVVLGGGVGESGKAGQGYEERVEYAVELYKNGYAGHIIFSSGYVHIFKETLVMKALAVSLGVPESAIMLESKASSTYDSVLSVKEILSKEHWDSIILLTSPYHMLRVSKVFDKFGGNIKVSYAPIPRSSFYAHEKKGFFSKKINLQQVRAIAHEYAGILYYWWKGWI